jgi:thiol-disulfide isomerase/thioredoxin
MSLVRIVVITLSVLLLLASAGFWLGREPASTSVTSGQAALIDSLLQRRLPDAQGQMQHVAGAPGEILVVNFWATWCAPCREEMPAFSRLQDKYRRNSVRFVGISIDSADKVLAFSQKFPVSYPLLIGTADLISLSSQLGNSAQAIPFTLVFDRTQGLAEVRVGPYSEKELSERLQQLL